MHPPVDLFPILVAPSHNDDKRRNTIRQELFPIACWRMDDFGFAFGSSFVRSDSQDDFQALDNLRQILPGSPISIFGHADPVGDDSLNKRLSGHRAQSIYAILVHDPAAWESLYQSAGSSEGWGDHAISHILSALGYSPSPSRSDAVKQFQRDAALQPVDGIPGPHTRARLFEKYMAWLCPNPWPKSAFLGHGQDSGGRGDFQGCSEFNPLRVFSQEEHQRFQNASNKAERNAENEINRRVVIFFFRPGSNIATAKWPCPRAADGPDPCRKRFWSDAQLRRNPQPQRREFAETLDTFACRFYHRLARFSPCEGVQPALVELVIPLERDFDGDPTLPDRLRIRQLDGPFSAELTEGDPDVVRDGDNPLNFFQFQLVPSGLYAVDVFHHDSWCTILNGLSVSPKGTFLGDSQFQDPADSHELGVHEKLPFAEIEFEDSGDECCC